MTKIPPEIYEMEAVLGWKYAYCRVELLEDDWVFDLAHIHQKLKNRFLDLKLSDIWVSKNICYVRKVPPKAVPILTKVILSCTLHKEAA